MPIYMNHVTSPMMRALPTKVDWFTAFSYHYYTLKMLCIKNNFLYHFNDHDEGVDVDYHDHAEGADDFWRQEWNVCVE